jgi:RNA polymerase sigma-70 factor (ECF subfamily)
MSVGILEKLGVGVRRAAAADPVGEVVTRAKRGDPAAFGELFRRHVGGVHRHLLLLIGPDADIDDLVQLVFLNVFQSLHGFKGQAAFSTWLFRITINVARQELRVRKRLRRLATAVQDVKTVQSRQQDANQERQLASWQQIYEVLDRLSFKKRETYILYMYEGYSLDEIARLVRSSVSTIGSRLQSARREILRTLAERNA